MDTPPPIPGGPDELGDRTEPTDPDRLGGPRPEPVGAVPPPSPPPPPPPPSPPPTGTGDAWWPEEGTAAREPHRGTLVLTLGITSLAGAAVSFLCCPFLLLGTLPCGIAAWFMARKDLRRMDEGIVDPAGRSSTHAGSICGIIGAGMSVLALVLTAVMFGLALFAENGLPR